MNELVCRVVGVMSEHGREEKIRRDHVGLVAVAVFEFDLPLVGP